MPFISPNNNNNNYNNLSRTYTLIPSPKQTTALSLKLFYIYFDLLPPAVPNHNVAQLY